MEIFLGNNVRDDNADCSKSSQRVTHTSMREVPNTFPGRDVVAIDYYLQYRDEPRNVVGEADSTLQ